MNKENGSSKREEEMEGATCSRFKKATGARPLPSLSDIAINRVFAPGFRSFRRVTRQLFSLETLASFYCSSSVLLSCISCVLWTTPCVL